MIEAESRPSDADLGVRRLLSRSLRRIVLMTIVATLPLVAFPFRGMSDSRFMPIPPASVRIRFGLSTVPLTRSAFS